MGLTKKIKAFCREYTKDYNGRQAAIRAGYKESSAATLASRLLANSEVIEEIRNHQKELLAGSCLTEEKVINQLQDILTKCMAAVPVMEWDYDEHAMKETGQWTFDSKGALKAIEMLGKHLGMFEKGKASENEIASNLIDIIKNGMKEDIRTDDIQELQQAADAGADMVEQT